MDDTVDPRIERTRRRVLQATAALIGECGFGRTTIEAVSERSGVARSTIYRHWPRREDLLVDAISHTVGPADFTDSGDVRSGLVDAFTGLGRLLSSEPVGTLAASLIAEARRDPQLREIHRRFTAGRRGHVVALVEAAITRGELPAGTDADRLAHELAAPMFYRAFITHEAVDEAFVGELVDRCLERCRRGEL